MSTSYTDLLAKSIVDHGFHVLTYNHILTSDKTIVSECKVSKNTNNGCFAGLGYANNIVDSTEVASSNVYKQIFGLIPVVDKHLQKQDKSLKKDYNCVVFEGLHPRTVERDIYDLCADYGDVIDIEHLYDDGNLKATVFMSSNMQLVVDDYNGKELDGNKLSVYLDTKHHIDSPLLPPRTKNVKREKSVNRKYNTTKQQLDNDLAEYMKSGENIRISVNFSSPNRSRSPSPRRRSPSPRRRSPSPTRSRSPYRSFSESPKRTASRSPSPCTRSPSPLRVASRSPSRSKSPYRSPSPKRSGSIQEKLIYEIYKLENSREKEEHDKICALSIKNIEIVTDQINNLEDVRNEDDNIRKRWICNGGPYQNFNDLDVKEIFNEEIDLLKERRNLFKDQLIKYDLERNKSEQKLTLLKECLSALRKK